MDCSCGDEDEDEVEVFVQGEKPFKLVCLLEKCEKSGMCEPGVPSSSSAPRAGFAQPAVEPCKPPGMKCAPYGSSVWSPIME